jgi:hypothetical protein
MFNQPATTFAQAGRLVTPSTPSYKLLTSVLMLNCHVALQEMSARHRVRYPCIQIIKTATVPAKDCKRANTQQVRLGMAYISKEEWLGLFVLPWCIRLDVLLRFERGSKWTSTNESGGVLCLFLLIDVGLLIVCASAGYPNI